MVLIHQDESPLDQVWVSLDLETTGLSADDDEIIEVGAVKFQGERILDTFQSFTNPHRRLSDFIKRYTGISQADVDRAPSFGKVSAKLAPFIGSSPVVGHNIAFDLGFLSGKGLKLSGPRCDTWDLAYVLMPGASDYSLSKLAASLGIDHARAHRAVEDALATKDLFLKLAERALELDVYTLAEMERLAGRSSWVLSYFIRALEAHKIRGVSASGDGSDVGATGIDIKALRRRLHHVKALRPNKTVRELDVELVASLLRQGGPLSRTMAGFEERPQQVEMARAVGNAINNQGRLIVEAGTGVGKSLAYLLPAAIYALTNNKRVVVSTNTINLQEQLLNKDAPAMMEALSEVDGLAVEDLKYTQLKGRANYLCLRRLGHLRSSDALTESEARIMAKLMVWLKDTGTGDRSELNLSNRSAAAPWERLSAQGALDCNGVNGVCFLRAARDRAAGAHLVIVNHALLMSDLTAGGALIPKYDVLIVDEAHHLEREATRHLGFELSQAGIDDYVQSLGGDRGLLRQAVAAFRGSSAAATRREAVNDVATEVAQLVPGVREAVAAMFGVMHTLVGDDDADRAGYGKELRITSATRSQPGWSQLEIQWENANALLGELQKRLTKLLSSLEDLEEAGLVDYEGLMLEAANAIQIGEEQRGRLAEFVTQPQPEGIYWVTGLERTGQTRLNSAPLHVGEHLEKILFSEKESVILTSATLSTNGAFDHISERTGFSDADELLVGSPFDYTRAALLCLPKDMPEPTSWAYQGAVEQAITDAAVAAGGRTMALFTSYAALNEAAAAVRGQLRSHGLSVLAQGIDGTPHQLLRKFVDAPESVLLGTASFWEGVDLAGESLKVLLLARLPFSVPSEPVFAARSELLDNPFNEYAVPQAVLRLRQGFGRLIRTKKDKGVVVILDRRIVSRRYGKAFLESLPPVTSVSCSLHELGDAIRRWNEA